MTAREPMKWTMRQVFEFAVPANYSHLLDLLHAETRTQVLREAAEIADQAGAVYAARGDNDRASAAFALMEQFKDMADAATPTSKEN